MHIGDSCLQQLGHAMDGIVVIVFRIPGTVFWPYFTGAALFAVGLIVVIKHEIPQARGMDKIMPFGRLFLAIPMAVFGADHFAFTQIVVDLVPHWIPAHLFWAYLVGVALIAAALSIVVKKCARLAATLLGIMLLLFVVLMHIPNVAAEPSDRFAWAVALRDLAFSGGAFAFAGAQMKSRSPGGTPWLVTLARFFIAIPALFFGLEHFLHPKFVPGVPLDRVTPAWIPGLLFWAYLAGTVLVITGGSLLVNRKARLAAVCLAVMIFLLVLFVYVPILAANLSNIGDGLNYLVDTLAFSGAALVLADALPREKLEHV